MPANQQLFDSDASSLSDLSDSSASSASPPKKPAARKTKAAAKGKRGATHNSKPSIGASSETAGKGKKNAGKGRGAAASSTKPGPKTKTTKAKSKASGGALHTDGQLYCICRTEYDGKQFMIACDRCMEWYHGKCVGIKPASAKKKKTFICAEC
ncbi:uncharacterized protein EV422DRAFT_499756, partial [Fimicolochytrium jonesii]|uniref:uncharacterized protein n=1 Tax=Fimicolochytrium jonesii TaxID=1396493 RepID=UPI0022FE5F1F